MVYKYLCVLVVVTYTEMLIIERKLVGDVITGISSDDCAEDNTKKWMNEKCVCNKGYETAIVINGIIQCKNRSDILNFFGKHNNCMKFFFSVAKSNTMPYISVKIQQIVRFLDIIHMKPGLLPFVIPPIFS